MDDDEDFSNKMEMSKDIMNEIRNSVLVSAVNTK